MLVDEAHGAHLIFHPDLPPSASSGADLGAKAHKTLPALTQSAYLHVGSGKGQRHGPVSPHCTGSLSDAKHKSILFIMASGLGRAYRRQGQGGFEFALSTCLDKKGAWETGHRYYGELQQA